MAALPRDMLQVQQCMTQLREIDGNIAAEHYYAHSVPTPVLKGVLQYCNTVVAARKNINEMREAEYSRYIHWRSVVIVELLERGVF